jgi:hypothetical protein
MPIGTMRWPGRRAGGAYLPYDDNRANYSGGRICGDAL